MDSRGMPQSRGFYGVCHTGLKAGPVMPGRCKPFFMPFREVA
ncbi:hypothetical protein SXCC_02033 [Gluconacetobacter sp. SXCC-1]|nr:hypothetical protein SXCC_02033 [Gluconacetobacter sp. SXCC-1]